VILLLGHAHGATQIDIKRRTITDVVGRSVAEVDHDPALSPALEGGASVLLIKLKDVEYRAIIRKMPATSEGHYVANLEVRWPASGKAKTLMDKLRIQETSRFTRASPNGLYAVLKYREPAKDEREEGSRIHYLIVDNGGNILDRLFFQDSDLAGARYLEPFVFPLTPEKPK
jgi:hypothetical protein